MKLIHLAVEYGLDYESNDHPPLNVYSVSMTFLLDNAEEVQYKYFVQDDEVRTRVYRKGFVTVDMPKVREVALEAISMITTLKAKVNM